MLDCANTNFADVEDISGNELMPNGTLVMLNLKEVGAIKPNVNGKKYFTVLFEVSEGQFTGKEMKENFYVDGKDFALQKTKLFVRYVLETTIDAHKKDANAYKIASYKTLETGKIVAKTKVKGFFGENGDWIFTNEIETFSTPREDSSTYKIYQTYKNGEQPWQNDFKPTAPVRTGTPTQNYGVSDKESPPIAAYDGY